MADSRPGLYRGEMKEQRRHGYGRYTYSNSFFEYEGEWKNGKKHGHGKLLFKDGSYYEGEFINGEIVGNGFRYWANTGNTYSGQFLYGELHGHGVMQYKDGQKYEGDFCYGVQEGHGILIDKDGQRYEGSFYKAKRHGGGKMKFKCQAVGNVNVDKQNIDFTPKYYPKIVEAQDAVVTQLVELYECRSYYPLHSAAALWGITNGDEYEGDWILDQRQGHGLLQCADGSVYEVHEHTLMNLSIEGQWRNDTFSGQGSIIHCSGVVYDGQWVNGYPVAQPKKMVILGPEVIDTVPGSSHSFHIQLQNEEGDIIECESGRLLEISAGIRDGELLADSKNSLYKIMEQIGKQPIESPFGFQYISYPLMAPSFESRGPQVAILSTGKSLLALAELLDPKGDTEPESEPTPPDSGRDTFSSQDGMEDSISCPARLQRSECGSAIFSNVILAPPPTEVLLAMQSDDDRCRTLSPRKVKKRRDKSHVEKMPTSQENIEGIRTQLMDEGPKTYAKDAATLPGEYVIMVHDVTSPPFMGQHLPPAFSLLRILSEKVLPEKILPDKGKRMSPRNEPPKYPGK